MNISVLKTLTDRYSRTSANRKAVTETNAAAEKSTQKNRTPKRSYKMPQFQIWAGPNFFFYVPVEE